MNLPGIILYLRKNRLTLDQTSILITTNFINIKQFFSKEIQAQLIDPGPQ